MAPVALVRDAPGGALDRVVADPDVTTFLNDRFHPTFELLAPGGVGSVTFLDGCGCRVRGPATPADAAAFIALANEVMLDPAARRCLPSPPGRICPTATNPGL